MFKIIGFRVLVLIVILVGLSACSSLTPPPMGSDRYIFEGGQGGAPDIYQVEADAMATAQIAQAYVQATRDVIYQTEIAMTAESGRITQAAQMDRETATARAIYAAETMTAEVYQTAQAEAILAEHANQTATSAARETAGAIESTATVQVLNFLATQTVQSIQATQAVHNLEVQKRALDVERDRLNNTIRAFYGYALWALIVIVVLFVVARVIWLRSKVRHFQRGAFSAPGYIYDVEKGKLLLPELAPGSVVSIDEPPNLDPAAAAYIKANAQRAEAIRAAALSGRFSMGGDLAGLIGADMGEIPSVEVIDAESVREVLDEVDQKLLESPE